MSVLVKKNTEGRWKRRRAQKAWQAAQSAAESEGSNGERDDVMEAGVSAARPITLDDEGERPCNRASVQANNGGGEPSAAVRHGRAATRPRFQPHLQSAFTPVRARHVSNIPPPPTIPLFPTSPGIPQRSPVRRSRAARPATIDLTQDLIELDDDLSPRQGKKRKVSEAAKLKAAAAEPPPPPEPERELALICSICLEKMKEEMSTVCGHIFCRSCIVGAIEAQKRCPTCRKKLGKSQIHRIYLQSSAQ